MIHGTPLAFIVSPELLSGIAGDENLGWMYELGVLEYGVGSPADALRFSATVVPLSEEAARGISIVRVSAFELVIGPFEETGFVGTVELGEGFLRLSLSVPLSLRLSPPAIHRVDPSTYEIVGDEGIDVLLGTPEVSLTLGFDAQGELNVQAAFDFGATPLSIDEPFTIAETGIVIEQIRDLGLTFSEAGSRPAGAPGSWRGLYLGAATLRVPSLFEGSLDISDFGIGTTGLYGNVQANFPLAFDPEATPRFTGPLATTVLGMEGGLSSVGLGFTQNIPTEAGIRGKILLPFFDAPVDVEVGIDLGGGFTVGLASPDGLFTLTREGILEMELTSIGFGYEDDVFTARLSGSLKPLLGADAGLEWPTFAVKELSIDSEGNVRLEGGWLDLDRGYTLSLFGFQLEITRVGFGQTDDGGKWVGFSGGLKLVEGLSAGASVEGLRITWYEDGRDPAITLNGVGVEFEVPGVLAFKGQVSYREFEQDGAMIRRFDGGIDLDLISLGVQVEGKLVVGVADVGGRLEPFMAIYLAAELPAGIPLWSTGLGLYGMAGLFALQMEPDKTDEEKWYAVGGEASWFHKGEPGVTDLTKWEFEQRSLALGAGVTIGTVADNGFTFSGRLLLVIVFPGPVVMLEGRANILKERASLSEEPLFHALAVLDARAGEFLIGLDARYRQPSGGELIDIGGGAETFFSLSDADAWHLYLGKKEPREHRIRAQCLTLFEANAYLMLDADRLQTGAWVGWDKRWTFGPLRVVLEAWIEGNVVVSWRPVHFHGDLWLHGKAELSVFGFGLGLSVDAKIAADVFDPYHIRGELSVAINLPWPLPDFDADITLEWGPAPRWPALPLPLQEVAVEHLKVGTSWPLPRVTQADGAPTLLLPNYDAGEGIRIEGAPAAPGDVSPPADAPVVPLDARPRITFSRPVHDEALVGTNPQPPSPAEEWIGDPAAGEGPVKVRYTLEEVALQKHTPAGWSDVARAREGEDEGDLPAGISRLYGSWAPIPALGGDPGAVGQTKLWIWSKNPFDYTRRSSRSWEEWFTDRMPDYPCVPIPERTEVCHDFAGVSVETEVSPGWAHPDEPGLRLAWLYPPVHRFEHPQQPVDGFKTTLCLPNAVPQPTYERQYQRQRNMLLIALPDGPNVGVRLTIRDQEGVQALAQDAGGAHHGPFAGGTPGDPHVEILMENVRLLVVIGNGKEMCLFRVCILYGTTAEEAARRERMAEHLAESLERWKDEGEVLEPHHDYRLRVVTRLHATASALPGSPRTPSQTEYAYFRTEGPPGLANLSLPPGTTPDETNTLWDPAVELVTTDGDVSGDMVRLDGTPSPRPVLRSELNDLSRYVAQTVPPTVPGPGEKQPLPRPVYRAYDAGVQFDEDYVALMYRMDGRDLTLQLFDANDRPVRDARGRIVVLGNEWDVTDHDPLEDETTHRWVTVVNDSTCAGLDTDTISRPVAVSAGGYVLEPDALHEGRLVPLLLHERFSSYGAGTLVTGPAGRLGGWMVVDQGATGAPSRWEVVEEGAPPTFALVQRSNLHGGSADGRDPAKPGTMLVRAAHSTLPAGHPEQPANWTDYRLAVQVRAGDDDAIGVVFRYQAPDRLYRFSMDRERGYRRLVRIVGGVHTVLAEDDFVYVPDRDYQVVVEAVGSSLRIHLDGEPVFDVTDEALDAGSVGLYCWASENARFSDVRVDDYRVAAPVVYRFRFTTSRYANFFHQAHGYQDLPWHLPIAAGTDVAAEAAAAVALPAAPASPGDDEVRAFGALVGAADALRDAMQTSVERFEVSRVTRDGDLLGLLVRSPEPVGWLRTTLETFRAPPVPFPVARPGTVKLTGIALSDTLPEEESATLLLRDALSLSGYRVERRALPGPIAPVDGGCLLRESFEGDGGGLFREPFGPGALDRYEIVDQGTMEAPSLWNSTDGYIEQTRNVWGGTFSAASAAKPGTMAVTGRPEWRDVRVRATLRPGDDDDLGVVFRYVDEENYYRFSMNGHWGYRRLVRCVEGACTPLWEDGTGFDIGRAYALEVVAASDRILVYLDETLLCSVRDDAHAAGRVGLYSWAHEGARFEALSVEAVERDPVLWEPPLADLSGLTVVDAPGAVAGPSAWSAAGGTVKQTANVYVPAPGIERLGTHLVGGPAHDDLELSVRLRSDDNDALGVLFRYVDEENYYRFSMDRQRSYRRLVRLVAGVTTLLWEDAVPYEKGETYDLTLRAVGGELTGWLDGARLFRVTDGALRSGRVGLYCRANVGARFERLVLTDRARYVGRWEIRDEGTLEGPSEWRMAGGALRQTSNIHGGDPAPAHPDKPGTQAVAGDPTWSDYRITVSLRADDDDAVGVLFRYVDEDNYYRLSLDAQRSYRRLVKKENGVFTTLWNGAGGYTSGERFTLTVDVDGDRLVGSLGGARLFDLRDGAHATGRVGLYCWAAAGVRFESVDVCPVPLEGRALFRDRFSEGDMSAWTVVDEGTLSAPSDWRVVDGVLVQRSNIHSGTPAAMSPQKLGTHALAGDPAWTDYVFTARLRSGDDDAAGVVFRYRDAGNYYLFSMDRERRYRHLVKRSGGVFSVLWSDDLRYGQDRTYEVTVVADGPRLRGYLDGVPVFAVEDGEHDRGRIGLYTWADDDATFSQVRVYPLGVLGRDALFEDDFDAEVPGRWDVVDQGDREGPSSWRVDGGWMVQESNLHSAEPTAAPEKLGTMAVAGADEWTDYRLSVHLRADGDNDALGVAFRYVDEENHYRFSMDQQRDYRRLVRRVGGVTTTLWEDTSEGYELNQDYVVTVECVADELRVYLNGIELARVRDDALPAGRIGLYVWAHSGARFGRVHVVEPGWFPYHEFGREPVLPAGTRVRVFSGGETAVPAPPPGTVHRFVEPAPGSGSLHLGPGPVDLRVRDAGGEVVHRRRFLPESAFAPVALRTLRNADGTAFFLLPAGGGALDPGIYRLRFRFRRDAGVGLPPLSQAGDRSDEVAVLDVPHSRVD